MCFFEDDELFPGDEVEIRMVRTVSGHDGYLLSTTEGEEYYTSDIDFEVTSAERPENWPPEANDVWRAGHSHFHFVGDYIYDEDGSETVLSEWLEENGFTVAELTLAFRPGVLDASVKTK
jgi:urease accessory protein UreE